MSYMEDDYGTDQEALESAQLDADLEMGAFASAIPDCDGAMNALEPTCVVMSTQIERFSWGAHVFTNYGCSLCPDWRWTTAPTPADRMRLLDAFADHCLERHPK